MGQRQPGSQRSSSPQTMPSCRSPQCRGQRLAQVTRAMPGGQLSPGRGHLSAAPALRSHSIPILIPIPTPVCISVPISIPIPTSISILSPSPSHPHPDPIPIHTPYPSHLHPHPRSCPHLHSLSRPHPHPHPSPFPPPPHSPPPQGWALQRRSWCLSPWQRCPPFLGGGRVQDRLRTARPPPHVRSQRVHGLHADHAPSTAAGGTRRDGRHSHGPPGAQQNPSGCRRPPAAPHLCTPAGCRSGAARRR